MKMKPRNERTRLILTLELAVVLPAAALVILSAWHVLHIQRDRAVEAAIQRDFSQVLAISEKQINQKPPTGGRCAHRVPQCPGSLLGNPGSSPGGSSLRCARFRVYPEAAWSFVPRPTV